MNDRHGTNFLKLERIPANQNKYKKHLTIQGKRKKDNIKQ